MVLAILLMATVVFFGQRQPDESDGKLGELVLPEMRGSLDKLEQVKLVSSSATASLTRNEDGQWSVDQKGGYPADFSKLASMLDGMSRARYRERKTSKPGNFSVLDLQGVDESSSKAVLVQADAPDMAFALLIGATATGGKGQYVRHPGEVQAWLVDHTIDATADPGDWLDPLVMDVDEEKILGVTETSADGEVLEVSRSKGEDNMTVKNVPEGRELRYPTVANQLARALTNLRLEDVIPRSDADIPEKTATAAFDLADGGRIVAYAWTKNKRYFLTFDSENWKEDDSSPWTAWRYEVTSNVFDKFTRTMADMIKAEKKEKDADQGE